MLVQSSYSRINKPMPRDMALTVQGSAKYDHIKKAAENLMRQQHSDKTEIEITAQRMRKLENDKSELLEANTKLLECKVKLEAVTQAGQEQYNGLRFDCIANQTLCSTMQEFASKIEKRLKSNADEIAVLKSCNEKAYRNWENCERILASEVASTSALNSRIKSLTSEKDHLVSELDVTRNYQKEAQIALEAHKNECEQLKSVVANLQRMNEDSKIEALHMTQKRDALLQQLKDLEVSINQKELLLSESELRVNSLQEGQSKTQAELEDLKLQFTQQAEELRQSKQKVEDQTSAIISTQEHNGELERSKFDLESQLVEKDAALESFKSQLSQSLLFLEKIKEDSRVTNESLKEEMLAQANDHKQRLDEERDTAHTQLNKVTQDLIVAQQTSQKLAAELEELHKVGKEAQITSAESEERYKARALELTAQVKELQQEVETFGQKLEAIQKQKDTELQAKQAEFDNLKARLLAQLKSGEEISESQLKEASEKLSSLTKEKFAIAKELEECKGSLAELQKALDKESQSTSKSDDKDKKKKIDELNRMIDEQNKELLDLKRQLKKQSSQQKESEAKHAEAGAKSTPALLVLAKDVPTEADTTETTDSDETKKKRKKTSKSSDTSSPIKRVHFTEEPPKKYTYASRSRKAPAKPKDKKSGIFDEYAFRG